MASIHKNVALDASAADVWAAVRDFGALHTRLVPGFVLDTKRDGDARIVATPRIASMLSTVPRSDAALATLAS